MNTSESHALLFHLGFALVGSILLWLPVDLTMGVRVWAALVLYNIALPVYARRRGFDDWVAIWTFVAPLSLLMIGPDWFLVSVMEVLVFPGQAGPRIGPVPLFMGLMWTIPLFLTVFVGTRLERRSGGRSAVAAAGAVSLVVFAGAELTLTQLPIWRARNVTTVGGMAPYVVCAEVVLGAATYLAFRFYGKSSVGVRLTAAAQVMLVYTGTAAVSYLVVERVVG